jgi:histidyl-tRNA synthetase
MADKNEKMKARLARGFGDRSPDDIRATERMMEKIKAVYDLYGFEPVEQPLIEYTDALGKFLPDLDRPNEGVFSFQDDDEQWLSLRYDLTAPLARYVAETSSACRSRSAPIGRAGCSATRSQALAASASSCSSMPTPWARRASRPMPK